MLSRRWIVSGLGTAALLFGCSAETGTAPPPDAPVGRPHTKKGAGPSDPDPVSLVVTGDVLLHERLWTTARRDGRGSLDFGPLLAPIKPLVESADLAVCHLETPLARPAGPYSGFPLFDAPPQIVPALKRTGYDACTTASNHSFDRGAAGVDRTLATLDRAGMAHTGTARTPREAATTTILDVRGVKVALLSYTYGFNGLPYPDGQTWRANKIEPAAIHTGARKARQAGADIVVVVLHWGDEYQHRPNEQQRALAPELVADSNIDLVVGHHAHVVQPLQKIRGKWVAYGLGNLIAAHRTPNKANSEGLLVRFTFSRGSDGRWSTSTAEYAALLVTDSVPTRVLDVRHEAPTQRLRLALRRTESVVTSLGATRDGAKPIVR